MHLKCADQYIIVVDLNPTTLGHFFFKISEEGTLVGQGQLSTKHVLGVAGGSFSGSPSSCVHRVETCCNKRFEFFWLCTTADEDGFTYDGSSKCVYDSRSQALQLVSLAYP